MISLALKFMFFGSTHLRRQSAKHENLPEYDRGGRLHASARLHGARDHGQRPRDIGHMACAGVHGQCALAQVQMGARRRRVQRGEK